MPLAVIEWAFKQRVGDSAAKLVLIALADHADPECVALFEVQGLMSTCEMTVDQLRAAFAHLQGRGLIERVNDPRIVRQTQLAYRLKDAGQ